MQPILVFHMHFSSYYIVVSRHLFLFTSLHDVSAIAFQGLKDRWVKNQLNFPISFRSTLFLYHFFAFCFILPGPESGNWSCLTEKFLKSQIALGELYSVYSKQDNDHFLRGFRGSQVFEPKPFASFICVRIAEVDCFR